MNYEASAFGIFGWLLHVTLLSILALNHQIVLAKDWDQVIHMVGRFGATAPIHVG